MTKTIVTHSGTFHADEITAIALLHVFTDDVYFTTRHPHQAELPKADYTIDIGGKLDPKLGLFDHHQYELGMSSAGLIWQHLGLQEDYPQVSALIELVDQNDVGIRKAKAHEYPRIIGAYNSADVYNDTKQFKLFCDALEVAKTVLKSMKEAQDQQDETEQVIGMMIFSNQMSIAHKKEPTDYLEAPKYLIGWDKFLNGEKTPHIRCLMWPKSEDSDEWHAQIIPTVSGEYGLHGRRFDPCDTMTFVHANGFFCVAPDKQTMLTYLNTK